MKAILPVAGKGTRLRPHTLTTPKALVRVGGRPVMGYILDDLIALGVHEVVFVVGYLRDAIREYVERAYPDLEAHYVVQEVQDGTAGAIHLAEPFIDEDVLIVFVDTLFDADLSLARSLEKDWAGVIWAKEVEDYQRFGVILTDADGAMQRIIEKPKEPVSKLANIGLYYIRDWKLLFEGIRHVLAVAPGPGGEFFLTDAFQYMVDRGARIRTAPVGGWYDCGKTDTLLETNLHLLQTTRGGIAPDASVEGSELGAAVRLEEGVSVRSSVLASNVTLERGAAVDGCKLRDCIVGERTVLQGCDLHDSVIGNDCRIEGVVGQMNAGPFTEVNA
jgi:glucose-1-phosphate thymidylyltransferase